MHFIPAFAWWRRVSGSAAPYQNPRTESEPAVCITYGVTETDLIYFRRADATPLKGGARAAEVFIVVEVPMTVYEYTFHDN
jgi:hypothetical protein